jgi:hypothetical protein
MSTQPLVSSCCRAAAAVAYAALCYEPQGWRPTTTRQGLLSALGLYGAAVMCDRLDRPVYWLNLTAMSGHTLKHLLAGAAGLQLVCMMQRAAMGTRSRSS